MAQQTKKYFEVKLEGMAPVILTYRIYAENEEEAYKIIDKSPHMAKLTSQPIIDMPRVRRRKISIKDLTTGLISFIRNF